MTREEMEAAEARSTKLLEDAQSNLILAQEAVIAAQGGLFEARHLVIMAKIEETR